MGGDSWSSAIWPVGILRKSGFRVPGSRSVHVKYKNVGSLNLPTAPQTPTELPLDVEEPVSCFCRKARRKERDGEPGGDNKPYLEEALLERKLPELDMRQLVELPHGLDYNEWLASHTLAVFDHVNLVYGTISEFCTAATCPDMIGPAGRTYYWYDERGKKSRLAAPQYIDCVMTFAQRTISDEGVFPTKYANEFPSSFECTVRKIVRLLFHVVAHVYAAHFREVALLRLHSHLHLTFAHLTALHRRFSLIDHKETEVLRDLEVALRLTDDTEAAVTPTMTPTPAIVNSTTSVESETPVVTQPLPAAAVTATPGPA